MSIGKPLIIASAIVPGPACKQHNKIDLSIQGQPEAIKIPTLQLCAEIS